MAGIETEISRLKSKDVKVKRRAVRHLFEADVPSALKGFIPLLNDEDIWFRTKSLEAHRRWASTPSDLAPLMDNEQRLVGELLSKIDAPELAIELLENPDSITRSFAAKSLSSKEELHKRFSLDDHHSVRVVAAEFSKDSEIISSLISDAHSSVRRAAIANASRNNIVVSTEVLNSSMNSSDPSLRALLAAMAVKEGGEILEKACKDSNPKVKRAIVDSLKMNVNSVDDRIEIIAKINPEIALRWLRGRHDPSTNVFRWKLIEDTSIDSRVRAKLLEQMEGRVDIDIARAEIVTQDSSKLVKLAAENLLASLSELRGEQV